MNLCRGYVCHPCSSGSGTMCKKKCCAIRPGKAGTGESAALCRWRRLKEVTWLLRLQQGSTVVIRSQVTAKGRWRQSWVTDRVCTSSPLCCGFIESLRYQRIANSVQLTGLRFIFTTRYEDGNGLSRAQPWQSRQSSARSASTLASYIFVGIWASWQVISLATNTSH